MEIKDKESSFLLLLVDWGGIRTPKALEGITRKILFFLQNTGNSFFEYS